MKYVIPRRIANVLLGIYRSPLTVIRAPSGFGKTDLIGSFLRKRRGVQSFWIANGEWQEELPSGSVVVYHGQMPGSAPKLRADLHLVLLCSCRPDWLEEDGCSPFTLELGEEQLRFTRNETEDCFYRKGLSLSDEVWSCIGGWPGLVERSLESGGGIPDGWEIRLRGREGPIHSDAKHVVMLLPEELDAVLREAGKRKSCIEVAVEREEQERIHSAAKQCGLSLNAFVKEAIQEKLARGSI